MSLGRLFRLGHDRAPDVPERAAETDERAAGAVQAADHDQPAHHGRQGVELQEIVMGDENDLHGISLSVAGSRLLTAPERQN